MGHIERTGRGAAVGLGLLVAAALVACGTDAPDVRGGAGRSAPPADAAGGSGMSASPARAAAGGASFAGAAAAAGADVATAGAHADAGGAVTPAADAGDGAHGGDGASAHDASAAPDGALPGHAAPCQVTDRSVYCEHAIVQLPAGGGLRNVYWAAPLGVPPAAGWPLALIFQGSLFGPSFTWQELDPSMPFGGFYQGLLHAALLEAGFVVVEPEAEGGIAWQTNAGGDYEAGSDHALMQELFRRFAQTDDFGPIDVTRLYASGISSGGYMTSRMAVSHPGELRALAIQSGSYATCLGPLCSVPATLPSDHPPTLFLHGDIDATVPIETAIAYHEALAAQGVETEMVVGVGIGHAWLASAPQEITAWFLGH